MARRSLIAEAEFDVKRQSKPMPLQIFKPAFDAEKKAWFCEFSFGVPFRVARRIYGENSLQALFLALKVASSDLYGSDLYRSGNLGIDGEYGGDLLVPATELVRDIAPYPF